MTRCDEGARLVYREAENRSETNLRDFFDEEAITWQDISNNAQVAQLWLYRLNSLLSRCFCLGQICISVLRRSYSQYGLSECFGAFACISQQVDLSADPAYLGRIDVDTDDLQAFWAMPPANVQKLKSRADDDGHIGLWPKARAGSYSEAQRMIIAYHTTTTTETYNRCTQNLCQLTDFIAGLKRARANKNHWRFGFAQNSSRALYRVRIDWWSWLQRERRLGSDSSWLGEVVPRCLKRHDAWPARAHLLERSGDMPGCISWLLNVSSVLAHTLQNFQLARELMQLATTTIFEGAHHVASQSEHWRIASMCRKHRGTGVQNAWARHHSEHAWAASGASITKCHVSAGLLVAGTEDTQRVGVTSERIGQTVDLSTRECKYSINTVSLKALDDSIAASHGYSCRVLSFHLYHLMQFTQS
ncbi:hypothetical protein D3C72_1092150 [compost metagenome]